MKKEKIYDLLMKTGFPILVTVLFAISMAGLAFFSIPSNDALKLPLPNEGGIYSIIKNTSLFIAIATVSIALIFFSKKLKNVYMPDFFIVIYLVVGTIFTLLFGKQFFNVPVNSLPLIYIVFGGLAYLGFYSIYLIILGTLPERLKNFIFIFYSSIIGVYFGISIPLTSIIAVILALSFVDMFWVYRRLNSQEVQEEIEKFMVIFSTTTKRWGIGLGDLTCYSMLVTCSFITFGIVNCILSTILILIGSISSMKGAEKYTYFPGLPISLGLGAVPLLINSIIIL